MNEWLSSGGGAAQGDQRSEQEQKHHLCRCWPGQELLRAFSSGYRQQVVVRFHLREDAQRPPFKRGLVQQRREARTCSAAQLLKLAFIKVTDSDKAGANAQEYYHLGI